MYKNDLQSFCHFYKGETVCPFKDGDKQMFWLCEKWWTEQIIPATDAGCKLIAPILKEYTVAGWHLLPLPSGLRAGLSLSLLQSVDR